MSTYSFVKNSANPQTIEETQLIMTYELSRMFECLYGIKDLTGYISFAKTELSDYVSMCRMLCEQADWNFHGMVGPQLGPTVICHHDEILVDMQKTMGKMIRGLHYYKRFKEYRGDRPALSMARLMHHVESLCNGCGFEFAEIIELGESRYDERMQDLKAHGVNEQLKEEHRR